MRVMILSHFHPALSAGGAERAAYSLFEHLKASPEVEEVIFVARAPETAIGHSAPLGSFRGLPDEILATTPPCDPFTHCSDDYDQLYSIVQALCERFTPDIVHIHHFIFWGVEIFEIFKALGVRVVFTIHEFTGICHRYGQMVKTNGKLCSVASPAECATCLPDYTAGAFFLRERIFKRYFEFVDCFISPSEFLAERYAYWGLKTATINVIENPLSPRILRHAEAIRSSGIAKIHRSRRATYVGRGRAERGRSHTCNRDA